MARSQIIDLDEGYTSEVDAIDEPSWAETLLQFDDANLYQTWPYAAVRSGSRNTSHVVVRKHGDVVALAQARIARLPVIHTGIAYVQWGPLWRCHGFGDTLNTFRQAVRALRNAFVCSRGLTLRLAPLLVERDSPVFAAILAEEGFSPVRSKPSSRTLLMDLSPSLDDIRDGMRPHWKKELKAAERGQLKVTEGTGDDLFESFTQIYRQMVARKRFVEPNDIEQFRRVQERLPERMKMRIMLCSDREQVCAGLICSAIGGTAVYLFGATSDAGMKSRGSYLLHWKLLQQLKDNGTLVYDLNGINPVKNPGTYKFKSDVAGRNGREVCFLGPFDTHPTAMSRLCVHCADLIRQTGPAAKGLISGMWGTLPWPKRAAREGSGPLALRWR